MSGSLGSVTLDLNVDMTQFDTGLRRAKSEVDNLIRAAERNRVRLTLDTGTINRDLSRLDAQMRSLTSGTRTVSVRADASAAIGSINDAAARAAALQNTRVTIPVTADTSAAMGALSAIQTRAVLSDGGGWRLSGTKVWTSSAHLADFMIVLCRTATRRNTWARKHSDLCGF